MAEQSPSILTDLLELRRASDPSGYAYVFLDRAGNERSISYEALRIRARSIAVRLQEAAGSGDRVLLALPSGLDFIAAFFGCLYAGVIAVPVAPPTRRAAERWQSIANDAQAEVILTDRATRRRVRSESRTILEVDGFASNSEAVETLRGIGSAADDIALLQYTSGSTAEPKGVILSHRNILQNQRLLAAAFRHESPLPIVGWLPMHHDMGLIGNVLHALYTGSPAILMSPETFGVRPISWLSAISRYRAYTSGGPDSAYRLCAERITEGEAEQLDLSQWRVAFNGSETLRESSMEMFARRFGPAGFRRDSFVPCYGLAEATLFVTGGGSGRTLQTGSGPDARALVSCGRPSGDVEVAIVDPESRVACDSGQTGEVWIRGECNSRGYWGRPEEGQHVFNGALEGGQRAGYLRTGDLGLLHDGELYLAGRLKDLIIVRGRNFAPDPIEDTVGSCHAALRREGSAAVAVERASGEQLVILQEVKRGHDEAGLQAALRAIEAALSREHQLTAYDIVLLAAGTLRRTTSGKPRRAHWAAQYIAGDLPVLASSRSMEPEPAHSALAEVVARVLGRAVDIDAPLCESGLDSLALLRVAHAVAEFSGKPVNVADLLDGGSLRDVLTGLDDAEGEEPVEAFAADAAPLSYTQLPLWAEEQLANGGSVYTLAFAARVDGMDDPDALARAFEAVVERHPSLRMTLGHDGEVAVQRFNGRVHVFERLDRSKMPEGEFLEELRQRRLEPLVLERDGVIQATLFERGAGERVLLLRVHHLACDFRSAEILLEDLGALYSGREAARPPASYADFVAWQQRLLDGPEGEAHLRYWREKLSGAAHAPVRWSRPRPPVRSYAVERSRTRLGSELRRDLEALARAEHATLFVVLLSALKIVLARHLDTADVLVGTVASGRTQARFWDVIGDFANPVPLRTDLDGDPTVRSVIGRVRLTAVEALRHQDYPLGRLLDRLGIAAEGGWFPLFQIVFLLQQDFERSPPDQGLPAFSLGVEGSQFEAGPLRFTPIAFDDGWSPFDLGIRAALHDDDIWVAADANRALFRNGEVERLLEHFERVLIEMARSPESRVSMLPMLSPEQRSQILQAWNDTARDTGSDSCLHQRFEWVAARSPESIAAVCDGESVSYGELNRRANRLGRRLHSLGVGPGVMVGLSIDRSVEMVVALLAILKAGGAYVPLDPDYPAARLAFMLEDIGAPVLLTQTHLAARLPAMGGRVVCLDREPAPTEGTENLQARVGPDHLAYVIFTSGSTGRPKGILLPHRALVNQIEDSIRLIGAGPGGRILQFASFSFDASLWEIFTALLSGAELHLATREQMAPGPTLAKLLRDRAITHVLLSPSVLALLPGGDLPWLRTVIAGTERCSGEIVARWLPGRRFFNAYGPTETTVFCTLMECTGEYPQGPPIGRPLANTQAYILDVNLSPVPAGVPGDLYIGGEGLAWGYLKQPSLTAEVFIPNPFAARPGARLYKTGDRARFLENGEIEFLGRADTQIKIRGLRIETGEIEAALEEHRGVRRALVFARERSQDDVRLVAYILPGSEDAPESAELRRFARERLPLYMIPSVFVPIAELPLTPNNKVDVGALPAPDWWTEGGAAKSAEPAGEAERELVEVFASVLGRGNVTPSDDFFELGGDSVAALQVVARLKERGWNVSLRQIYEHTTISSLAPCLSKMPAADSAPAAGTACTAEAHDASIEAEVPLTPLQEGLLFHSLEQPDSGVYFTQVECRLTGRLDKAALQAVWQAAVTRHGVLRASVEWGGSARPVLRIHRHVELPWEELDWRGAGGAESRITELLASDRAQAFDLRKAPLARVRLVTLSDGEWRFILSHHHLLLDGWSLANLLEETLSAYAAAVEGRTFDPPQIGRFEEYVRWTGQQDLAAAEGFWRVRLAGFHGNARLSMDRRAQTGRPGARETLALDARSTSALKQWARERKLTLATLIQGMWSLVLGRFSGSSDVVFGVASAGRPAALDGIERMVGLFLNTVPVRAQIKAGDDLAEWLRGLSRQLLEAEQYGYAGLGNIQQWSGVARGQSLFESIVVMENYPTANRVRREAAGLEFEVADIHEYNNYPLSLAVHPTDKLSVRLFFDAERFDSEDVRTRLSCFAAALASLGDGAARRIGDVALQPLSPYGPPASGSSVQHPAPALLNTILAESFAAARERVAVRSGSGSLTYAELGRRSALLAGELRQLGVGPESLVGICAERSIEMVVAILAIIEAGAAYLPLDPAQPTHRLDEVIADSQTAVVLLQAKYADLLRGREVATLDIGAYGTVEGPRPTAVTHPPAALHPEQAAYLLYTSGSTGRPNGVAITHRAAANHMLWMRSAGLVTRHDRVLQRTPFHFDASVWEFFAPLIAGAELVLLPPASDLDPAEIVRGIREYQITVLQTVPTVLARLVEEPEIEGCTSLRRVFCGGEELTPSLQRAFYERLGADLYNLYGPTETTIDAAFWKCERGEGAGRVPIGHPVPGVHIHILDDDLRPAPPGAPGEIFIGGVAVARGYWRRPALTADRFVPDPFSSLSGARLYRTRDLGRAGRNGAMEYLGRKDRQLKLHGLRVEPGEIENALLAHPGIAWCAAGVATDPNGNERLVAWFVERPGHGPVSLLDLRSFAGVRLTASVVPSQFVRLEKVPLLPNGKTDYRSLPAPDWQAGERVSAYADVIDPVQQTLVEIWERVLGVHPIGIEDNFFDLGGDSILNLQVVAQAKRAGIALTPKQLFEHPRIRELAKLAPATPAAAPGISAGSVPLTPIQRWFFEQRAPRPSHFNQAVLLNVREGVEFGLLEEAVGAVVAQHEAIHCRFLREQELWTATIPGLRSPARVERLNLEAAPISLRREGLAAEMARLHGTLDIERGPLFRALVIEGAPDGGTQLFLVAHHLCVDIVSWRILLDDLDSYCRQRRAGQRPQLAASSCSIRQWTQWLASEAASETTIAEAEYWLRAGDSAPRLPSEVDSPAPDRYAFAQRCSVLLEAADTGVLLRGAAAKLRVRMPELLLSALSLAVAEWTGDRELLVQVDSHGRPLDGTGPDLSRAVGWFTTTYPLHLRWSAEASPFAVLKAVKQQFRDVPRHGLGYALCRYGAADAACSAEQWLQPEILFNYGGNYDNALRDDASFTAATGDTGPAIDGDFPRAYRFEVSAAIAGGRLRIDWNYSSVRDRPERVAGLAEAMARTLREFIALSRQPGLRPESASDFPLAGLDDAALQKALKPLPPVEDLYPLSPLQQGLLFHSLQQPESGVYFSQMVCRLEGPLDAGALRAAWQQAMERHELLRAGVIWEQTPRPLLCVYPSATIPWEELDLRGCGEGDLSTRLEGIVEADRARPFDFSAAPLMRATLVRIAEQSWTLVWSHHHVILDGWSQAIVLREVLGAYNVLLCGRGATANPARRFRDYIQWLESRTSSEAEEYWRTLLAGFEHPIPLAMAERVRREAGGPEECEASFGRDATAALTAWARSHQITTGTLIHAAWALLLARYSGLKDVVFGVAAAGRPADLAGADAMVGVFINTLPVRLTVADDTPVDRFLAGLQAQVAEHMRYPHTPLATIRACSSVAAPEALFHSVVVTDNYPSGALRDLALDSKLTLRDVRVIEQTNFPLALMVEVDDRLALRLQYDSSAIAPAAAKNLLAQIHVLLDQFVADAATTLGELSILTNGERRLIGDVNGAAWKATEHDSIARQFERQVRLAPRDVAVIAGGRSWTRMEIDGAANRLARALQARGVGPEKVAAVFLPRSAELIVALLAIVKAGGVFLVIDPATPEHRRNAILRDASPAVVLTGEGAPAVVQPALPFQLDSDWLNGFDAAAPHVTNQPDNAAYLIYTSGSTGIPKGVIGLHRGLLNRLAWMRTAFPYAAGEVCCQHINSAFVDMIAEIFGPLAEGVTLVVIEAHDRLSAALETHRVSRITVTPSLLRALLEEEDLAKRLPALELVISSGEVLTADLAAQLEARLPGRRLVNLYGSSEASADATFQQILPGETRRAPAIGRPIANTRVYIIVDDALRLAPVGAPGRLLIGGECLARGYWNRPGLTAERFRPDPFSADPGARIYDTGDLVRLGHDGILEYIARADSQVKIRGQRIAPEEVEAALATLPAVGEAAVIVRTNSSGEKYLDAYLTPSHSRAGQTTLDFGLFYFADSAAGDPADQYRSLLDGARFADQNGFSAVWVPERHFTPVGGAFPNPSVVLGALAVTTERVSLRAGSVVLPLHHPARVAEEWAVLDNLSRGRVGIAFTSGWLPNDFVFAPEHFTSRRAAMLERVQKVKALWRGDSVCEVNGLGDKVAIRTLPRPVQRELPVWLTCTGDPALFEKAGELGLNVLTGLLSQTVDQAAEKIVLYRRARARSGFDPDGGRVTMMIHTFVAPEAQHAVDLVRGPLLDYVRAQSHLLEDAVAHLGLVAEGEADAVRDDVAEFALQRYCRTASLIGSPESCLPMLHRLREIGVNELACLVDFVPPALMLSHLGHLDDLRRRAAALPALSVEQVRNALRDRLPEAMIPERVAWLDRLPVGETGKVARKDLPPIPAAAASVPAGHTAPRSSLEQRVAGIWAEVFALPLLGIDDDFFAIGGHSLLAIRIVWRLRRMFGIDLSVDNLFTHRDVRRISVRVGEMMLAAHGRDDAAIERFRAMPALQQAALIEPLMPAAADPGGIPRRNAIRDVPLSLAQEQVWIAEQFRTGGSAYNESTLARLDGPLDPAALEFALSAVVQRHESLRARFLARDGAPVQEFVPEVRVRLPVEDLRAVLPEMCINEARRRASEEAQRPFDIASAPLFRAALWRIADEQYLFLITAHLLVADGWSWRVLFEDLESVYRARVQGTAASLPAPPIGYGDFALWQRERAARGEMRPQLDFWKRQLESWSGRSPLPASSASPHGEASFGTLQRTWPTPLIQALSKEAANSGATLFSALLATFQAVLFGLSGEPDLAIAAPIAGRPRPELDALVGCFVNTVLLRMQLNPEYTFRELVSAANGTVVAAQSNQEAPLHEVLGALGAAALGVNILFAVAEGAPQTFAGLSLNREPLQGESGKFDVVLRVEETGGTWGGHLVYNRAALTDENAAALLEAFAAAITIVSEDPEVKIGRLAERSRGGARAAILPVLDNDDDDCLSAFERQVRNRPHAVAVRDGDSEVTYAELNAWAGRIGSRLRRQGVGSEDIIGLLLHRTPALVAAILGCWKAGAAFVAVDPAAPPARVAAIVGRSAAVLVDDDLAHRLSESAIPRIPVEGAQQWNDAPLPPGRVSKSSAAYVVFTSGSTGEPKGIVVEHRNIAAYTRSIIRLLGVNAEWQCGLFSSVAADLGYTVLFPSLVAGATLHLMPQQACVDPQEFAHYLRRHPLTCIKILPSHFAALTGAPGQAEFLPEIVIFGGEVLDGAWLDGLRRSAPHMRVFNHYGPAETTVGATAMEVPAGTGPGRLPLGRPLEHARIVILGADLKPVPAGFAGQIAIGGAGVSRGYLGRPGLTAESFIPDPASGMEGARLYRTGDTGRLLPDGTVEFLGRIDRQVKVHGFRVEPEELEVALRRHPAIAASAVRSWPGKGNTAMLAGYVVLRGGARPSYDEIVTFLQLDLPYYMLPGAIAVLPSLPLLPSGKVAIQRLAHPDKIADRLDAPYAAPETYTERVIAEVWAGLFGLERVSVDATFLSLGGHSLLAIQVSARLLESFGVEVPFTDIYRYPTIAKLARKVEEYLIESAGVEKVNEALDDLLGSESFRIAEAD